MCERPGPGEHNLLLVAPPADEREFDCCVDLLTVAEPPSLNVWSLGISLPPDERLRHWEARRDDYPGDYRIVSGQPLPQGQTEERSQELDYDPTTRITTLQDPKNLTRLGIELTESLTAWEGDGNRDVICFHSITTLLQQVPADRALRFLTQFATQARTFGAHAHYHVNPRAHDEQLLERLTELFDGVRRPGEA